MPCVPYHPRPFFGCKPWPMEVKYVKNKLGFASPFFQPWFNLSSN